MPSILTHLHVMSALSLFKNSTAYSSRTFWTTAYKPEMLCMCMTDVPKEIARTLRQDEYVLTKCKQSRFLSGGKEINPGEIYVTNNRLIIYDHKLFGRGTMKDIHYGDVANTEIKKGLLSNEILVRPRFQGIDIVKLGGLNKDLVYKIVQMINDGIARQGRQM